MTAAATLRDTLPVESVPEAGCARVVGASWQGVPCRNHKASDSCILTGTAEAVGVYAHCSVSREGLFGVGLAWDTMTLSLQLFKINLKGVKRRSECLRGLLDLFACLVHLSPGLSLDHIALHLPTASLGHCCFAGSPAHRLACLRHPPVQLRQRQQHAGPQRLPSSPSLPPRHLMLYHQRQQSPQAPLP